MEEGLIGFAVCLVIAASLSGLLYFLVRKGVRNELVSALALGAAVLMVVIAFAAGSLLWSFQYDAVKSLPPGWGRVEELTSAVWTVRIAGAATAVVPLFTVWLSRKAIRKVREIQTTEGHEGRRLLQALGVGVPAAGGAALGVLVSQYSPVFGGLGTLGQPWSPARQSLIGTHVLVFAVVGGGLGLLLMWLRARGPTNTDAAVAAAAPSPSSGTAERLAAVDKLLAQGAITKDEHAAKRADILRNL